MCRQHSNIEQFRQAQQIAKDHGMFIVEKNDQFFVYRRQPGRNICVGHCGNTGTLFNKVNKLAAVKEVEPCAA